MISFDEIVKNVPSPAPRWWFNQTEIAVYKWNRECNTDDTIYRSDILRFKILRENNSPPIIWWLTRALFGPDQYSFAADNTPEPEKLEVVKLEFPDGNRLIWEVNRVECIYDNPKNLWFGLGVSNSELLPVGVDADG